MEREFSRFVQRVKSGDAFASVDLITRAMPASQQLELWPGCYEDPVSVPDPSYSLFELGHIFYIMKATSLF